MGPGVRAPAHDGGGLGDFGNVRAAFEDAPPMLAFCVCRSALVVVGEDGKAERVAERGMKSQARVGDRDSSETRPPRLSLSLLSP